MAVNQGKKAPKDDNTQNIDWRAELKLLVDAYDPWKAQPECMKKAAHRRARILIFETE